MLTTQTIYVHVGLYINMFTMEITRSSAVAETARHFMSLNILLSHSRSFVACVNPYWYFIETMYVVPFTRYSALKNGVTLKLRVGSLKVTENGTVRKITHDFLSVGHSKYIRSCMLYHFQVI